jgi:hypothetical protein
MGLPTAEELANRTTAAAEELRRLQEASDAFFTAWEAIEQEGKNIEANLAAYVDKEKLKRIHDVIHASQ